MSLYVVEREDDFAVAVMHAVAELRGPWALRPWPATPRFEVRDSNARDGEWPAGATLPYEVVAFEGYEVPAFEGDVERIEWRRPR